MICYHLTMCCAGLKDSNKEVKDQFIINILKMKDADIKRALKIAKDAEVKKILAQRLAGTLQYPNEEEFNL
ncbi:hypothetical protein AAEX28_09965 [Lentisphaerota bacterium WC36G]|nr:hypothetical protein LJT99_12800 [Lentisphaerae bacterium WC36]